MWLLRFLRKFAKQRYLDFLRFSESFTYYFFQLVFHVEMETWQTRHYSCSKWGEVLFSYCHPGRPRSQSLLTANHLTSKAPGMHFEFKCGDYKEHVCSACINAACMMEQEALNLAGQKSLLISTYKTGMYIRWIKSCSVNSDRFYRVLISSLFWIYTIYLIAAAIATSKLNWKCQRDLLLKIWLLHLVTWIVLNKNQPIYMPNRGGMSNFH